MCDSHRDIPASEVRVLPVEARGLDRAVRLPARPQITMPAVPARRPQIVMPPAPVKTKAVEVKPEPAKVAVVERAPEVSDDVKNLRDQIRASARAVLADEARLPTGRAAKSERVKFRNEALQRYAKGLGIELPSGQDQFAEAANILRAKLMETFDTQEVEKLMPKFLKNVEA